MNIPKVWPVEVRNQNALAKIYRSETKRGYTEFKVVYYSITGKRQFKTLSDYGEAYRTAKTITDSITKGDAARLTVTSGEVVVYQRAKKALEPIGTTLDAAVGEYVSAVKRLPQGASLIEAVDFFRKRNPANIEKRTVQQVVDELLAAKSLSVNNHRLSPANHSGRQTQQGHVTGLGLFKTH